MMGTKKGERRKTARRAYEPKKRKKKVRTVAELKDLFRLIKMDPSWTDPRMKRRRKK